MAEKRTQTMMAAIEGRKNIWGPPTHRDALTAAERPRPVPVVTHFEPADQLTSANELAFVGRSPCGYPLKKNLSAHCVSPIRPKSAPDLAMPDNGVGMSQAIGRFYHSAPCRENARQTQVLHMNTGGKGHEAVKGRCQAMSSTPAAADVSHAAASMPANESPTRPDPAWGYTGHRFANRFKEGEEKESMAVRIARRRKEAVERRFAVSPFHAKFTEASYLPDAQAAAPPSPMWLVSFPAARASSAVQLLMKIPSRLCAASALW
eukprot:CAMPEP_0119324510 /NCGR_PEP_ID=MMETSP1333-20130426/63454_1 /TAXON_ID=418940 /ORGANISM="Scyphosphaera apsteinii, Strain RCC1455" /LENGTH=262 /DNA_ID=CAMNT_0007332227 /DNA_START=20 /DNA_END=804 /DNA_ORIENTATION=-